MNDRVDTAVALVVEQKLMLLQDIRNCQNVRHACMESVIRGQPAGSFPKWYPSEELHRSGSVNAVGLLWYSLNRQTLPSRRAYDSDDDQLKAQTKTWNLCRHGIRSGRTHLAVKAVEVRMNDHPSKQLMAVLDFVVIMHLLDQLRVYASNPRRACRTEVQIFKPKGPRG